MKGDPKEIEQAISSIGLGNVKLQLSNIFYYGDFYRLLAKIAHGFLVANCGEEGCIPFLPDLILGRSPYLSHYVGGLGGDATVHMFSHWVCLETLVVNDVYYIAVNIQLMGGIAMPTYQVIAARLT